MLEPNVIFNYFSINLNFLNGVTGVLKVENHSIWKSFRTLRYHYLVGRRSGNY